MKLDQQFDHNFFVQTSVRDSSWRACAAIQHDGVSGSQAVWSGKRRVISSSSLSCVLHTESAVIHRVRILHKLFMTL